MTAIALLHPDVSAKTVERFRACGIEISMQDSLDHEAAYSAALIFGGDGTVHRHLPQLHKRKIPMLVVPAGSGNDFAKALGIFSVDDALEAWKRFCADGSNVRAIDLGVISRGSEEVLFCCVAGIGMDAEANARANRMPAWLKGRGGYVLAALESLLAFKPVEISVRSAEREIRQPAFFVAIGNAHRYGGGMKIAPRAVADDGILDVCFVSRMSKLKLLCWVPTIFFGGHLGLKGVEYFGAKWMRIEAGRELDIYADGDFAAKTPVEIRVLPRALRVIVPAESQQR
jgi:diacylglycerol kinase (ATP)